MFQDIKDSLRQLYLEDKRPWLVGFSGNIGPKCLRPGRTPFGPTNDAVLFILAGQRATGIPTATATADSGEPFKQSRARSAAQCVCEWGGGWKRDWKRLPRW